MASVVDYVVGPSTPPPPPSEASLAPPVSAVPSSHLEKQHTAHHTTRQPAKGSDAQTYLPPFRRAGLINRHGCHNTDNTYLRTERDRTRVADKHKSSKFQRKRSKSLICFFIRFVSLFPGEKHGSPHPSRPPHPQSYPPQPHSPVPSSSFSPPPPEAVMSHYFSEANLRYSDYLRTIRHLRTQ